MQWLHGFMDPAVVEESKVSLHAGVLMLRLGATRTPFARFRALLTIASSGASA